MYAKTHFPTPVKGAATLTDPTEGKPTEFVADEEGQEIDEAAVKAETELAEMGLAEYIAQLPPYEF